MDFLSVIWNEGFTRPLFNALIWLYTVLPWQDLGVAIILLTIVVRVVLAPLFWKAQQSQKALSALQPEIKKIQEQFKKDREAQSRALMELYKTHKVNPFSGCLIAIVQMPILIALYLVFLRVFDAERLATALYSFVTNPGALDHTAFGFLDLATPNLYLGAVAAAIQFLQLHYSMPATSAGEKSDFARMMQVQMKYMLPLFILYLSYTFPAAPMLYWTIFNLIAILQEIIMRRRAAAAATVA